MKFIVRLKFEMISSWYGPGSYHIQLRKCEYFLQPEHWNTFLNFLNFIDFRKVLEEQINTSCNVLEESIVQTYEKHSKIIQDKLQELFAVLERISTCIFCIIKLGGRVFHLNKHTFKKVNVKHSPVGVDWLASHHHRSVTGPCRLFIDFYEI